ncbi:MAG: MFS transporter [Clostridia bacterium]|nr:MFS transporter [Clostridia bacterium]
MKEITLNKLKKFWDISAYSFADMLGGGVGQVISLYYLSFLLYVAGLTPIMAGIVTGIGKIWDGIIDPFIGVIVDKTNHKFGKSKFWMLISVIPIFIFYFMLWYSFGITNLNTKFIYYIFAYILWTTAFSLAIIPYESLLPRMVSGYDERTSYSSVRMVFSGVSCVVSTYLYELLVPVTQENPLSANFTSNFAILGVVLGLFFAVPVLITALGSKEKKCDISDNKLSVKFIFAQYKEVFRSKTYKKYFALGLSGTFVGSAISASMVLFIYLTYGNIQNYFLGFSLVFLIVNIKGAIEILFFLPNVYLMKKKNKHRPYLIDIPLIMVACIIILFINNSTPIWILFIAVSFLGAGVSCLGFVPMTLLPDLSDVDELIHGKRREGVNAGLTTLGKQIVSGLAITVYGFVLEGFGLDTSIASPEAATQSSILAIKIMYCIIPIFFGIIMILISISYPLNKNTHDTIKKLISKKKSGEDYLTTIEEKNICEKLTGLKYEELWVSKKS